MSWCAWAVLWMISAVTQICKVIVYRMWIHSDRMWSKRAWPPPSWLIVIPLQHLSQISVNSKWHWNTYGIVICKTGIKFHRNYKKKIICMKKCLQEKNWVGVHQYFLKVLVRNNVKYTESFPRYCGEFLWILHT